MSPLIFGSLRFRENAFFTMATKGQYLIILNVKVLGNSGQGLTCVFCHLQQCTSLLLVRENAIWIKMYTVARILSAHINYNKTHYIYITLYKHDSNTFLKRHRPHTPASLGKMNSEQTIYQWQSHVCFHTTLKTSSQFSKVLLMFFFPFLSSIIFSLLSAAFLSVVLKDRALNDKHLTHKPGQIIPY